MERSLHSPLPVPQLGKRRISWTQATIGPFVRPGARLRGLPGSAPRVFLLPPGSYQRTSWPRLVSKYLCWLAYFTLTFTPLEVVENHQTIAFGFEPQGAVVWPGWAHGQCQSTKPLDQWWFKLDFSPVTDAEWRKTGSPILSGDQHDAEVALPFGRWHVGLFAHNPN